MRLDAKPDANQTEIVEAYRAIGASVAVTSQLGNGFPDLVVGFRGRNWLIEIKDGTQPPSKRRLTPAEKKFHEAWRGQVDVVNNITEALTLIGAL